MSRMPVTSHVGVAQDLGLTDQQRVFAEELAKDPEKNQTRAAKTAGSSNPVVQGSKWAAMGKVRKYLSHLTQAAFARAERRARGSVASLDECLTHASDVMRSCPPPDTMTVEDVDVARVGLAAAQIVVKHHDDAERPSGIGNLTIAFQQLDPRLAAGLVKGLLSGGGNGHGKVVDVEAKETR